MSLYAKNKTVTLFFVIVIFFFSFLGIMSNKILNSLLESDYEEINIKDVCRALEQGNAQLERKLNNKKKVIKRKKSPRRSPKQIASQNLNPVISPEQNEDKHLRTDQDDKVVNENDNSEFAFLNRNIGQSLANFLSNVYYKQAIQETIERQLQLAENELNNCIQSNFPQETLGFSDEENQENNQKPQNKRRSPKNGQQKNRKIVQSKKMLKKKQPVD